MSTELKKADADHSRDQRKLDEKTWKQSVDAAKEALRDIDSEYSSALDSRLGDLQEWYDKEQALIELQNANGLISEAEAESKLYELKKEYLKKFVDAQVDAFTTVEKLQQAQLDQLIALADTEEEREALRKLRHKVMMDAQKKVDDAYHDNRVQKDKAATGEELKNADKIKEARQQMLDDYKQAAETAVSAVFENQQQATENHLAQLEKQKEVELQAVGDNAEAKKAIEERYQREVTAIRRRQAVQEKLQAAFEIAINTAVAISKANKALPAPANIPLIIAAAALGAAQLAAVLSRPIPQFKDGKNVDSLDSYAGPALVGEAGRELWVHDGQAEVVDRPSIVNVGRKDVIYPNFLTEQLLRDDRAFEANAIIHRNQRQAQVLEQIQQNRKQEQRETMAQAFLVAMPTAEAIGKAVGKEIAKIPIQEFHFDEHGFLKYIREGNNRRTAQENKVTI